MTKEELVRRIVPILNNRIDILGDWVSEETEAEILTSAVMAVAGQIPMEARPFLVDAADGLTDEERDRYAAVTLDMAVASTLAAVPAWVRGFVEGPARDALKPVIDEVFRFAQKGLAIA